MWKDNLKESERLIIANQYQILGEFAKLRKDDKAIQDYENLATAYRNGFSNHYDDLIQDINLGDDELITVEEQDEVSNLLAMYRFLNYNYDSALAKYSDLQEIPYIGYDANNEESKYSYLVYYLNQLNLFSDLQEVAQKSDSFPNSHDDTDVKRNAMLKVYNAIKGNEDFKSLHDENSDAKADYVKLILEAK